MTPREMHSHWITTPTSQGSSGDPEAHFPYWSFTKTALAVCALKLVEKGTLSLETPTSLQGQSYTLRQLLAHTSGLPDYGHLPQYHAAVAAKSAPWSRAEMLDKALANGPLFAPDKGWSYSNIGYMLVGELLTAATNTPLACVICELITDPLGLTSVKLAQSPKDFANLHWPAARTYDPRWVYHGCLTGTASDAAHLLHAVFTGALLHPQTLTQMLETRPLGGPIPGRPWTKCGYALGLMAGAVSTTGSAIGHSGAGPFSVNAVYHYADAPTPITVACFCDGTDEGIPEHFAANIAANRGITA